MAQSSEHLLKKVRIFLTGFTISASRLLSNSAALYFFEVQNYYSVAESQKYPPYCMVDKNPGSSQQNGGARSKLLHLQARVKWRCFNFYC